MLCQDLSLAESRVLPETRKGSLLNCNSTKSTQNLQRSGRKQQQQQTSEESFVSSLPTYLYPSSLILEPDPAEQGQRGLQNIPDETVRPEGSYAEHPSEGLIDNAGAHEQRSRTADRTQRPQIQTRTTRPGTAHLLQTVDGLIVIIPPS